MQLVHLPRSSVVYGTIKNEIVFEKLRALPFDASFNEFIYMVLPSSHQRRPLKIFQSFVTVAYFGNNSCGTFLKPLQRRAVTDSAAIPHGVTIIHDRANISCVNGNQRRFKISLDASQHFQSFTSSG